MANRLESGPFGPQILYSSRFPTPQNSCTATGNKTRVSGTPALYSSQKAQDGREPTKNNPHPLIPVQHESFHIRDPPKSSPHFSKYFFLATMPSLARHTTMAIVIAFHTPWFRWLRLTSTW